MKDSCTMDGLARAMDGRVQSSWLQLGGGIMKRTGAHHIGLATYDYEGIVDFYTRVLGWEIAWQDLMTGPDGTVFMKHVFFDLRALLGELRTAATAFAPLAGFAGPRFLFLLLLRHMTLRAERLDPRKTASPPPANDSIASPLRLTEPVCRPRHRDDKSTS